MFITFLTSDIFRIFPLLPLRLLEPFGNAVSSFHLFPSENSSFSHFFFFLHPQVGRLAPPPLISPLFVQLGRLLPKLCFHFFFIPSADPGGSYTCILIVKFVPRTDSLFWLFPFPLCFWAAPFTTLFLFHDVNSLFLRLGFCPPF